MKGCNRKLLAPLALASVAACWGSAQATQPANPGNGNANANGNANTNNNGRWALVFQGSGNVTQTRCQGMSRGENCITAASRKDAARRAGAQRAAGAGASSTTAPGNSGNGGKSS